MQLILEADSDINIKAKMTTVEDSIDKLMNGVAEIEKTPEKGNLSNLDKESSLNRDNLIENKKDLESEDKGVILAVCENIFGNKTSEKENISNANEVNSCNENNVAQSPINVEAADNVPTPINEDSSKNNTLKIEKNTNLEINANVDSTEIKKNNDTGDQTESKEALKPSSENVSENKIAEKEKLSDVDSENNLKSRIIEIRKPFESGDTVFGKAPAIPLEDNFENKDINDENRVILDTSEATSKIIRNGESRVDISEVTENSLDKYEEGKLKEDFKEESNDEEQDANKLKADNPENISEYKIKEIERNDGIQLAGTTPELCENLEAENDVTKQVEEEMSFSSKTIDKNNSSNNVCNNIENCDGVKNQTQEYRIDVNEQNVEKVCTDKVTEFIPESEKLPEITVTDIQTDVSKGLDSTEISTEKSTNESSDVKKADNMECDEVNLSVTETTIQTDVSQGLHSTEISTEMSTNESSDENKADNMECDEVIISAKESTSKLESTYSTMDCDSDDLNLSKEGSVKNLSQNEGNNQIITKEDAQVGKTDSLGSQASVEVSDKVMKDINEVRKTNSPITESTVVENMDTTEKNKDAEVKAVKVNEFINDLSNKKENVDKENSNTEPLSIITNSPCKDVNSDIEEVKVVDVDQEAKITEIPVTSKVVDKTTPIVKLSNTLNILSDDEDEPPKTQEIQAVSSIPNDSKQCINIEDDDDVMVIEDTPRPEKQEPISSESTMDKKDFLKSDSDTADVKISDVIKETEPNLNDVIESTEPQTKLDDSSQTKEKTSQVTEEIKKEQPLLPKDLFKSYKKNLTEMTRDDLEEFCILKIVESIIDRGSLNEIKTKLKTMSQTIEEYKKKAMMLTKQNRDLQVVLKSIQEEQKKGGDSPIVPLKITRSVGMQVLMTDKNARRKIMPAPTPGPSPNVNRPPRNINQSPRQQIPLNATNQQIPVPRLVPATSNVVAANKAPNPSPAATRNPAKLNSTISNGMRNSPPAPKAAEKRGRAQSITVDLTDDEPPPKMAAPPVRVVSSQNLLTPRAQMASNTLANPRKVYIPIGSNQNPSVRPGQTIMLKNMPTPGPRPRSVAPITPRGLTPNQIRMNRVQGRHPAPLPDAVKQYQPPNWKALPPAPDLKLSKVENGIVISWKIDGYQEDSYEEIASYQLYAYQETSSPPNTSLWKKIGDVKALPLPMACTLTQFMAGYKYYFAVRAVDIRSRLGPFSLPGSILLLNKM